MRPQLVIDSETTALTPNYDTGAGVIWEFAAIERESGAEHLWRMKPDLAKADPSSLAVGRYYERTADMCTGYTIPTRAHDLTAWKRDGDPYEWSLPSAVAAEVAPLLHNVTLIAANPTFDAGFLTGFLNHHGQAATWHFRLRDIGSMAYGYLQSHNPARCPDIDAGTDDFALALGVDLSRIERHTALGDCRLVAEMLAAIEGGRQ